MYIWSTCVADVRVLYRSTHIMVRKQQVHDTQQVFETDLTP